MNFNNKVVIVTGSSSGIGAATAIEFSKHGADVVLVARNKEKLEKVATECAQNGKQPFIIIADVTKDEDTKKIINETIAKYGKIDVLVNNAGIAELGHISDENALQVFDRMINLNLRSVVQLTHLVFPYIIQSKGNIVNISSDAALGPFDTFWAYCVSKAGVDHFTRCAAQEGGEYGVRVNGVNPGPVKTDIAANMNLEDQDGFFDSMAKSTALQRSSEPKEIADIVLFLASDKAKGVTGASWLADNGSLIYQ